MDTKEIENFILESNQTLRTNGATIGLSGGVDSTVCATLCTRALGNNNCLGVIIPAPDSNPRDEEDAISVAIWLNIPWVVHPLSKIMSNFNIYEADYETQIKPLYMIGKLVPRNLENSCIMKMRGRAYILSYYSSINNYFQCQTLNKTEWLMGWFDPFADALGDVAPLFHLYKSEVYELAKHLKVPNFVMEREPGPGTWPILDRELIGNMDFETLDSVLRHIEEGKRLSGNIINIVHTTKTMRELPLRIK